ncbi:MAG TPA: hypothetical protein RMH99_18760 [Sandaracinaceae bacterium LLY-WYZ-13_1]|nr:hypothetical protein [Sandaracinaceae bacterium LLY-WYZ-13_1]
MLDKLERKLGRFAIPNLVTFLVAGQVGTWVLAHTEKGGAFVQAISLNMPAVLSGEAWRLVSFMFVHPPPSLVFGDIGTIFYFLLTYMFGRGLEQEWGAFKFNVYVGIGWLATVLLSFLFGGGTNLFVMESIMFAFAYVNPSFELRLFFILPVKIKWIAMFVAASMLYSAFQYASIGGVLLMLAGTIQFPIFFTRDIVRRARGKARQTRHRRAQERAESEPTHVCTVCGKTDLDDPQMQFRYCTKCAGGKCYCMDHLRDHEHVRA